MFKRQGKLTTAIIPNTKLLKTNAAMWVNKFDIQRTMHSDIFL
jgi:hypothetical protein